MNTPFFLKDFIIHDDIAKSLITLKTDVLHTIFYGNKSSGKKTLAYALINNINNNIAPVQNYREIKFDDITVNGNSIPIQYIQTPFHFEFNLYEYGLCDRDVITNFIKRIVEYKTVNNSIRIILLHHIDRIPLNTQILLFELMDKYIQTSRFFFITNNISGIHRNLLSRTHKVRVHMPSIDNISKCISSSIPELDKSTIHNIIEKYEYHLYNINMVIHQFKKNNNDDLVNFEIPSKIILNLIPIIEKKDIRTIKKARVLLYDFLLSNITMNSVFSEIVFYVMKQDFIPLHVRQSFLQNINNLSASMSSIEYNILIIEYLIFKVKKLFNQYK
jgi:DNA polymerase III delta prime subunit